jgi:multiple sugar transport system permease protein
MSPTPHLFPNPITFEHFINIFAGKSFHRYIINSAIVSITTTFLCLLFGSVAAYALARLDIRGRFGILGFVLGVSMFPQIAIVGPLYVLGANLGWLDTYRVFIVICLALGLLLVSWVCSSDLPKPSMKPRVSTGEASDDLLQDHPPMLSRRLSPRDCFAIAAWV